MHFVNDIFCGMKGGGPGGGEIHVSISLALSNHNFAFFLRQDLCLIFPQV